MLEVTSAEEKLGNMVRMIKECQVGMGLDCSFKHRREARLHLEGVI